MAKYKWTAKRSGTYTLQVNLYKRSFIFWDLHSVFYVENLEEAKKIVEESIKLDVTNYA